jgi:hypothetical protein
MKRTYTIDYRVYFKERLYQTHTMKIKNCLSEAHAKVRLEQYLQKKYYDFESLVVTSCKVSTGLELFDDIFGNFTNK